MKDWTSWIAALERERGDFDIKLTTGLSCTVRDLISIMERKQTGGCLCVCALNDCLKRSPSWEMNFTYLARGIRIRNSILGGKTAFYLDCISMKEKEKFPIFNPKSK